MNEKQIVLIIEICILVGVVIALIIVLYRPVYVPEVTTYEKLLKELGSTQIMDEDLKLVELFKKDNNDYLTKANLEWGNDVDKFISVCETATRILKAYNNDLNENIYLLLVKDIINRINKIVFQEHKDQVLKREDDYKAIVYMARLFNTFEYIANNDYKTTKTICHDLIIDLLPELNHIKILGIYFNSENVIYTIIPRLLTHYLEPDKENFKRDVESYRALEILEKNFLEIHNIPAKREKIYLYDYHYHIYKILKEPENKDNLFEQFKTLFSR